MNSASQLKVAAFMLPKEGARESEREDALAFDLNKWRFAVSDGATEAFDARSWARMLAESWAQAEAGALLNDAEFSAWAASQGAQLAETWEGRALSWFAEEKRRRGSFAAFLGVEIRKQGNEFAWRAVAVGDSCLVQTRVGEITEASPLNDSRAFKSAPRLVGSQTKLEEIARDVQTREGALRENDVLYLLTDAVAA